MVRAPTTSTDSTRVRIVLLPLGMAGGGPFTGSISFYPGFVYAVVENSDGKGITKKARTLLANSLTWLEACTCAGKSARLVATIRTETGSWSCLAHP